jgi:replicative DNA helicase
MTDQTPWPQRSSNVDSLRLPPHSIPAEQNVIGGMLLVPDGFHRVADTVAEVDFYRHDHRMIFRTIERMTKAAMPIDVFTVEQAVADAGLAEQIESGYLLQLASTTASAANIRGYAAIVREKSLLRGLIEAGTRIAGIGFNPEGRDALAALADAQSALGNLLQSQPCELEAPKASLRRMMERGQRRAELKGKHDGLLTGLTDLDGYLRGMKAGQLIIIAGRPKQGKTTLAMNIAEHVAIEQDKRVAVHSLEMQPDELIERAVCSQSGIPHEAVQAWDLTEEQWNLFTGATRRLSGAPLVTSKPRNVRVEQLVAQTRRAHMEAPLGLVVIDYLQLIDTAGAENKNHGIGEITRQLKLMAGDIGVPVILLSQLNRQLELRTNKRPIPADLRDSGSIEQDADCVLFVYRDETYHEDSPDKGTAEIIVSLQRGGRTGTVRVASRLDVCRFDNLDPGWARAEQPEPAPQPSRWKRRNAPGAGKDRATGGTTT